MAEDYIPQKDRTPILLDGIAAKFQAAAERFAAHGHFDCRQRAIDCAAMAKRLASEAREKRDC